MVAVGRWVAVGAGDIRGGTVTVPEVQNNKQNYLTINLSSHLLISRNDGNEAAYYLINVTIYSTEVNASNWVVQIKTGIKMTIFQRTS